MHIMGVFLVVLGLVGLGGGGAIELARRQARMVPEESEGFRNTFMITGGALLIIGLVLSFL